MPDCGPFGETFLEARDLAIVDASLVNNPGGGNVETVLTCAIHLSFLFVFFLFRLLAGMRVLSHEKLKHPKAHLQSGQICIALEEDVNSKQRHPTAFALQEMSDCPRKALRAIITLKTAPFLKNDFPARRPFYAARELRF